MVGAPTASATYINCGPGYYHRFAGHLTGESATYDYTTEGTTAQITSEHGYICDSDTSQATVGGNFSGVWVMIASYYTNQGYSQSGLLRFWNHTYNHLYAEDSLNGGATYRRVYSGTTVSYGNISTYKVKWISGTSTSCGDAEQEWAAGVLLQTTNFGLICNANWTQPWVSQWFGETLYPSSDVDGFIDAVVTFASMQTQDWSTNNYVNALPGIHSRTDNPTAGSTLGNYCANHNLSCDHFDNSSVSSNSFHIDANSHH